MQEIQTGRRAAHREQRRMQFIQSAAAALAQDGIHNTRMSDVATAAGVSKIVLYRYFESKGHLVHAVLEHVVDQVLTADDLPVDQWSDRLQNTLTTIRNIPGGMRLLVRFAANDPEFGHHYQRLKTALQERTDTRISAILGDQITRIPVSFISEAVTTFLIEAYVLHLENTEPLDDTDFLDWVVRSVTAIARSSARLTSN